MVDSWLVVGGWEEPVDWQKLAPGRVRPRRRRLHHEPATKKVHQVDLTSGKVVTSVTLDAIPNEISGTVAGTDVGRWRIVRGRAHY